ncbi:hypothetical protein GP486_006430 [Trichoglossum hirsutum]|uniref:Histone-lysine N-methyltransferase ASH1L n=1 Tax=Trichoglossum hirsutum TaxID=265104 RepID=A0A9P8IK44_9PEZI|nr:hypothetical protein GP486_006430 [Trichoglossum hirsutum]
MARPAVKPQMSPTASTRSPSLSSTTIARSDSSISISSTPATTNTEASSVSAPMNNEDVFRAAAEAGANAALARGQNNRVKRARSSLLVSYNENVLSGTAKRRSIGKASGGTAGEESLGTGGRAIGTACEELGESIQVSDLEWRMGHGDCSSPTPGRDQTETKGVAGGVKRRRSVRLELVSKAKGVLGARTQDITEGRSKGSRNSLEGSVGNRRDSLRPRETGKHSVGEVGESPKKKARFSDTSTLKGEPPATGKDKVPPPRPKRKVWLSHGLYIGQEPEFEAYLTERKNRAKAVSRRKSGEKKPFLPLPMFTGQRLLECGRNFALPFDIFSPLPARQPKPEEWRKVTKNVFVGEAAEIWKKNKIKEVSKCVCTPEKGCDEDCQNRHMFYECDENNCAVGAERCTNRSFRDLRDRCKAGGKYNIGVEVFKTEDRGYGVRANRSFEPNQIILEYAGEIITQEECERRMKKEYKKKDCFYLMVFDQNMIIDATRGSIARFVNHSCEPNCKMVKWTVSGGPRMALFAGENGVMTGEELCYDYNFDVKEQKKEVIKPLVRHAKRKLKQLLGDGKDISSSLSRMKKRKLATPRSTKPPAAPTRATSKTAARNAARRIVSRNLPGRRKRQLISKITKTGTARLRSKQKTALERAVRSMEACEPVDDSTIPVRSSPRKKVKTFKAAESLLSSPSSSSRLVQATRKKA